MTQPHCNSDSAPCDSWFFPKTKIALKGKRFQTVNEIQENKMGQLMVTGRTVWGSKVPTLKGTRASLSYVQCFLHLESPSVNVSIFQSTWLDTFWTDLVYLFLWRPLTDTSCINKWKKSIKSNGGLNPNKASRNKDRALTIKMAIFWIYLPNIKHGSFGEGKWGTQQTPWLSERTN